MTQIKICGLTCYEDARKALDLGADYLGFVLYAGSPRHVTVDALAALVRRLPRDARCVGVFVNDPAGTVAEVAVRCGLSAAQVHGDEAPEGFAALAVPVWRAVRIQEGRWVPEPGLWHPQRYVIDAFSPAYGGTGVTADWVAAGTFCRRHPAMLAGGLNAENVAEAIGSVQPVGVDVSSGIEHSPGRKDHGRMERFVEAVRQAARARQEQGAL